MVSAQALIWALVASFIIIALPLWESKDQILAVFDGLFGTNFCEYRRPARKPSRRRDDAAPPPRRRRDEAATKPRRHRDATATL